MKNQNKVYHFYSNNKVKPKLGMILVSFFDPDSDRETGQAVIVPNMAAFIRDVTEFGNIGAIKKRALSLSIGQMIKLAWWNKLAILKLAKKDFATGLLLLIQIEVLKTEQANPAMYILSDQVTDLAVALRNTRVLSGFHTLIQAVVKTQDGIMTNNLPNLIQALSQTRTAPTAIFAPFATTGYAMNPSKKICEQSIDFVPKDTLVAMVISDTPKEKEYLSKLGIRALLTGWF